MDDHPVFSTSEAMLQMGKRNVKNELRFKWGLKIKLQKEKGYQLYKSFFCNGLEFFLYDCVYIYRRGDSETTIGKLVKMFETESHERKVKVMRFFRPIELTNFFGDVEPCWNEIFLASGKGAGVFKCYFLEEVIKKCNVVCTVKDIRNPQSSQVKLELADYIFYRTYDVQKCKILKDFPDEIHQIPVKYIFNRGQDVTRANSDRQTNLGECGGNSGLLPQFGPEKYYKSKGQRVGLDNGKDNFRMSVFEVLSHATHVEISPCKKMKVLSDGYGQTGGPVKGAYNVKASENSKREAPLLIPIQDKRSNVSNRLLEVTKSAIIDKSKWFKQQPWEQRLRQAQEAGTLVLLENMDSTLSSLEVEELVQKALNQKVDVKMLQCTSICNPYCGKALVIFKSKEAAEMALTDLDKRCLMLSDGRPIVGRRGSLADPSKQVKYVGHLTLPKSLHYHKHTKEMGSAISTAHCSQANTLEYDMAMEWVLWQERSDLCWKKLYEDQKEEILNLKSQLKLKKR